MPTNDQIPTQFLPKEHLDLPLPEKQLPPPRDETMTPRDYTQPNNTNTTNNDHLVKTLLSWHAAGRPFRRRENEYYINIAVITLAVLVILFLFSQYMLMLLCLALVFLNYALTTVAPHDFRYKITSQGVTIENHFYYWDELFDFYFKTVDGERMVFIVTRYYYPSILKLTLGEIHREQIQSILLRFIPYREVVTPNYLEKAGDWLSKTFPLDKRPL